LGATQVTLDVNLVSRGNLDHYSCCWIYWCMCTAYNIII